jgi:hypothetical protein
MKLNIDRIQDEMVRETIQDIETELNASIFKSGDWKAIEIVFTAAVTNFKYPHNMGFKPKDALTTSLTGAGALTWNYANFDRTNLDISTTGPCVVRALVGTFFAR